MLQTLREFLVPSSDVVDDVTAAGLQAEARADQAGDTIAALTQQMNREKTVLIQENKKAAAAEEAYRILKDAGW